MENDKEKLNEWIWLLNTPKGDFCFTVLGPWSQEEAAKILHTVFGPASLNLVITGMTPRKRQVGPNENHATIYKDPVTALPNLSAGRGLFRAVGKSVEYEALMTAFKAESDAFMKGES